MTRMRMAMLVGGVLSVAASPSAARSQQDTVRRDSAHRAAGAKPLQIESGRENHTMRSDGAPHRIAGKGAEGMGSNRDQLRERQRELASEGCDPGPVDGLLGPRTRAAMRCSAAKKQTSAGATGSAGAAGTTGTGTGAGTTRASATGGMTRTMSSSDTGRSQTARHRRPPGADSARRGRTGAAHDSLQMGKPPSD
ncbi:MAG: hypothetical protein M3068_14920 [Gemmatimonadota bacterium]|nr:hypothetical protein [Gemmatimonadota bacterium]